MKKQILSVGFGILLFCVCLSGCSDIFQEIGLDDSTENTDEQSEEDIIVVIEASAMVVNSTGEPLENVAVEFIFSGYAWSRSFTKVTDSSGRTGTITTSYKLPDQHTEYTEKISYTAFISTNPDIRESGSVSYNTVILGASDGVYYWMVSPYLIYDLL